jgi:GAF domain-containing protein
VVLSDALRTLADPEAIQRAAATTLCEHLRADRALYGEVLATATPVHVSVDHVRSGLPSIVGEYRMVGFGEDLAHRLRDGRTVVLDDAHVASTLGVDELAEYARVHVRAHVTVPLVKDGRMAAVLSVHQATPRLWTGDEIALIEETAERTWAAIERARAEVAVRESEARLEDQLADATLLQSISAELVHEDTSNSCTTASWPRRWRSWIRSTRCCSACIPSAATAASSNCSPRAASTPMPRVRGTGSTRARIRRVAARPRCAWAIATSCPTWRRARRWTAPPTSLATCKPASRPCRARRLFARDGQVVGMLSTHWSAPHAPAERDLRLLDILARQAADLIERRQAWKTCAPPTSARTNSSPPSRTNCAIPSRRCATACTSCARAKATTRRCASCTG